MNEPEIVVKGHLFRAGGDGAGDMPGSCLMVAQEPLGQTKQVVGVGMAGVDGQNFLIKRFGALQFAALLFVEPLFQQRVNTCCVRPIQLQRRGRIFHWTSFGVWRRGAGLNQVPFPPDRRIHH